LKLKKIEISLVDGFAMAEVDGEYLHQEPKHFSLPNAISFAGLLILTHILLESIQLLTDYHFP
jgi:hypothetical protein